MNIVQHRMKLRVSKKSIRISKDKSIKDVERRNQGLWKHLNFINNQVTLTVVQTHFRNNTVSSKRWCLKVIRIEWELILMCLTILCWTTIKRHRCLTVHHAKVWCFNPRAPSIHLIMVNSNHLSVINKCINSNSISYSSPLCTWNSHLTSFVHTWLISRKI